jgi:hypothetical protein
LTIPFPTAPHPNTLQLGRPLRASACRCDERQIRDGDSCARCGLLRAEVIDRTHQERARAVLMAGHGVECEAEGCHELMHRPMNGGRPPSYCSKRCRKREARRRARERQRTGNDPGLALVA